MQYLKQSTASQSVLIGPFVDDTDGTTAETALTIANTDIRLSANGANMFAKTSGGGTHDELGFYTITLDATDTATVGRLQLTVKMAGALVVYHEFQVLEEAIFDALFAASATGLLPANVTQISGGATAADNAEAFFDGTGYAGTNNVIPTVTTLTGHTAQTGDSFARIGAAGAGLTAVAWNAAWDAEVQSEVQDAIEVNHLDHLLAVDYDPATPPGTATALLNELVESDAGVSRFTVNALENAPSGSGASAEAIADAVWDEALSGHVGAGSYGKAVADIETDATEILADTGTDGVVVAAASKTGYSLTATTGLGDQTGAVGSVTGSVGSLVGHTAQTGDSFARLGAPAGASVSADIAAVKAETAAIVNDTDLIDDATSGLAKIAADVAAILVDTGTTLDGKIDIIDGIVDDLKSGIIYGTAATGTLSTTVATSNLTGYADDQLIGGVIIWLSGNCEGERTDITDYASTNGTLTFTAMTTAPGNGDLFKIV